MHRTNIVQAALGATITVPTLEGDVEIEVPEGTQTGDVVPLKGKGVPHLGARNRRGDQLVTIVVETPRSLSDDQRTLLEALSESMGDDGSGPGTDADTDDKGWFNKLKDSLAGTE